MVSVSVSVLKLCPSNQSAQSVQSVQIIKSVQSVQDVTMRCWEISSLAKCQSVSPWVCEFVSEFVEYWGAYAPKNSILLCKVFKLSRGT